MRINASVLGDEYRFATDRVALNSIDYRRMDAFVNDLTGEICIMSIPETATRVKIRDFSESCVDLESLNRTLCRAFDVRVFVTIARVNLPAHREIIGSVG